MEVIINSVIIFASWNIGNIFARRAKALKPVSDLAGILFASAILVFLSAIFPVIRF